MEMDSRAFTSTSTRIASSKPKSLIIDTNHASMVSVSKTLSPSPPFASPFTTFRPSPLGPKSPRSLPTPDDKPPHSQKRASFPPSRPLRPFPSIVQSMSNPRPMSADASEHSRLSRHNEGATASPVVAAKRPPKTLEISSKWRGGFMILGMTQAEFSRRD